MRVIADNLWLCTDCMIFAVNGDVSGLSDERADAVLDGAGKLGAYLTPNFDSETEEGVEEFSKRRCACCASSLWGAHYRFVHLG